MNPHNQTKATKNLAVIRQTMDAAGSDIHQSSS